jgi:hypothetical protein
MAGELLPTNGHGHLDRCSCDFIVENQSFSWHGRNLAQGFAHEKHVSHDEDISQGIHILSKSLVFTGRVGSHVVAVDRRSIACPSMISSYSEFAKYYTEKKYKTYISKPDSGCQGRGIFMTKNPNRDIKP